jgi:transposase-like protein
MTDARAFRGYRFPAEVILWAVRWYRDRLLRGRYLHCRLFG